jgi:hypothetical protein
MGKWCIWYSQKSPNCVGLIKCKSPVFQFSINFIKFWLFVNTVLFLRQLNWKSKLVFKVVLFLWIKNTFEQKFWSTNDWNTRNFPLISLYGAYKSPTFMFVTSYMRLKKNKIHLNFPPKKRKSLIKKQTNIVMEINLIASPNILMKWEFFLQINETMLIFIVMETSLKKTYLIDSISVGLFLIDDDN